MEIHHATNKAAQKWQIPEPLSANDEEPLSGNDEKLLSDNNEKPLFALCPYCGREGYYQIPGFYEHCTYCGIDRISLTGQEE